MAAKEQKERKNRVGKTWQRGVCQGNKLGRIRGSHSLATHSHDNSGLSSLCVPGISRLINVPIFPRISAFFRVTGRQGLPCAVAIAAKAGLSRRLVRQSCSGDGGSAQREGGSKSVKVNQSDLIRVPRSVTLPRIEYK